MPIRTESCTFMLVMFVFVQIVHDVFVFMRNIRMLSLIILRPNHIFKNLCRFLHPLVYGEYPKTMQNIVGERLPKFNKEDVKMVKGAFDFIGVNQYTAYYMYDPHQPKPKDLGYQQDWNVGFACMKFLSSYVNMCYSIIF